MDTIVKIPHWKFFLVLMAALVSFPAMSQENIWDDLLKEEVEVANPTYKPVVGFGTGYITFMGDVKNSVRNPLTGNLGYKVNVSTFLDNGHFFKTNFNLLYGNITGNQFSLYNPSRNLNFQSSLITFGLNLEYGFGHIYKKPSFIRPFVSLGMENLQFNTKGDLSNSENQMYYYWTDGTIRNRPDGMYPNQFLRRDYNYETDLRESNIYNKGSYSQNSFALPLDAGIDLNVSNRVTLRLGHSFHFTFTDYIDNLAGENNFIGGDPTLNAGGNLKNDWFSFTYLTLHLDLFSDAKTKVVEKLFAMVDNFDYAFYGDEDNDGAFDGWDVCPETPRGVEVDSIGCPFDSDNDAVPDYRDKEPSSAPGAIVDLDGITLQDDVVDAMLSLEAIQRSEVEAYFKALASQRKQVQREIPPKFQYLDTDQDKYISFEEVLKAIDRFFDFESSLATDDIYQLNDFFFSQ